MNVAIWLASVLVIGWALWWVAAPWAKRKREAAEKAYREMRAKGVEVGRIEVTLHLKDGKSVDLEFVGEHTDWGDGYEWTTSAWQMFDDWMSRCGRRGMYSYDKKFINIDLVKEVTYVRSKHSVKHDNE